MKRRVLLLSGFVALALGLAVWLPSQAEAAGEQPISDIMMNPWRDMRPATCMPDRCFCEGVGAGVIRQPINTWSNLGFVTAGLVTLAVAVQGVLVAIAVGILAGIAPGWHAARTEIAPALRHG